MVFESKAQLKFSLDFQLSKPSLGSAHSPTSPGPWTGPKQPVLPLPAPIAPGTRCAPNPLPPHLSVRCLAHRVCASALPPSPPRLHHTRTPPCFPSLPAASPCPCAPCRTPSRVALGPRTAIKSPQRLLPSPMAVKAPVALLLPPPCHSLPLPLCRHFLFWSPCHRRRFRCLW